MENASKALLIVGGVFIALLVISVGAYLILSASGVSERFDKSMSDSEIEKFNQKFQEFEKKAYYVSNDNPDNTIEEKNMKNAIKAGANNYSFTNYNNASDVVSAINLAYNINKSFEYDIQKGIQITISIKNDDNIVPVDNTNMIITSNFFGITPMYQQDLANAKKDKKVFYPLGNSKNKITSKSANLDYNKVISTNWLLENFSNSKLINKKRVYEYGFDGAIFINSETGMVENVYFELIKNLVYNE